MRTYDRNRRVPVQGEGSYLLRIDDPRSKGSVVPGTVSWMEHVEAWKVYAERFGDDQSAKVVAQRGGFGYFELMEYLGRKPRTWRPTKQFKQKHEERQRWLLCQAKKIGS